HRFSEPREQQVARERAGRDRGEIASERVARGEGERFEREKGQGGQPGEGDRGERPTREQLEPRPGRRPGVSRARPSARCGATDHAPEAAVSTSAAATAPPAATS